MLYLMQHLLERSARKWPDRPAFRFLNKSLSYAELDGMATRLANCLNEQGVGKGERVAIYLNKSLECAVAVYGILKAGAVYVPLDPGAPHKRLAGIISDCDIRWLVSHDPKAGDGAALEPLCDGKLAGVIGLSTGEGLHARQLSWEQVSERVPEPIDYGGRTAADAAYIIYTSGSTGQPKGIVHSHQSGLSYALMAAQLYGLTPEDRLSNLPPLHFDQSIFDYFSGAAAGACTVIISEPHSKLPASLSKLIEDEALTVWYSVPFALVQLLLHGVLDQRDFSSLRWVLYGGEPFPTGYLAELMSKWPHARFCNVYGPAEVNQCTNYFLPAGIADSGAPIPIGRACPNVQLLVVDEQGAEVSPGDAGELLVRTPTMMRGYFGRDDLNRRAFYRRHNEDGSEDIFYRTGDLVSRNAGGELMFMGRQDRQVKLRGYRVELDEVEAAFDAYSAVQQSAAFVTVDEQPGQELELAVCLQPDADYSERELRRFAAERLPAYAIPSVIHVFDDFPRTSTGKVDRNRLREWAAAAGDDPAATAGAGGLSA